MEPIKSSYLDEYRIIRTLGSGYHAKVKLAEAPNKQLVAIKRFKQETATIATLKHQLSVMSKLHHENLVNLIDVRDNATYKKKTGETYQCFAIVLEYAGGGELFDFIALGGRFSPNVARTYFYQMMAGLNYMHEKGYAHRDIKPENLLLTDTFVLKIADFGFATLLQGKDKSGILHTKLGTDGYMAPEIAGKNYVGSEVDIFAAGVILFIMYTASPPFEKTTPEDCYYRYLREKNYNGFWNFHSKRRPPGFFPDDFKDLIQKMLSANPKERPTMVEIATHPWVKGPVLTIEQVHDEFLLRKKKVEFELERQRKEKEMKKAQRSDAIFAPRDKRHENADIRNFLSVYETLEGVKHKLPVKSQLEPSDFVFKEQEDYFFSALLAFLKTKKLVLPEEGHELDFNVEYEQHESKITATFTYEYDSDDSEVEKVELTIDISRTPTDEFCLSFNRLEGNTLYYKRLVNAIKEELCYCEVKA